MAIQNLLPPVGARSTLLNISQPTLLKPTGGYVYNISVVQQNVAIGYVYDWNSLATLGALGLANVIYTINPALGLAVVQDGIAPFLFQIGLIVVPGSDGMVLAVGWT